MPISNNGLTNNTSQSFHLNHAQEIFYNLNPTELIEHALKNKEGKLASNGAFVAYTGTYTGRTPNNKYIVCDQLTNDKIWWENNKPMTLEVFHKLNSKVNDAIKTKSLYIVDAFAGADTHYQISVRVICEKAWHALFISQLLIRPNENQLENFKPEWQIIDLCTLKGNPAEDSVDDEAVITLNFSEKKVLILGTEYAGEIKKSVFTILNALLPEQDVLSMHCSANIGPEGDTALFFGLSGTGKTTLSADSTRNLIGDDEHGWSDSGTFNFEGGCYAKCINLSREKEPEIWDAIRFGSVLENVILCPRRFPDYDDITYTENTRCGYPLSYISNAVIPSVGGHPKHIIFLTCDAFGVLPPISKLDTEQAIEYFLMGYTARVAGTEAGLTEPQAVFSSCFGQPFLPLHPQKYAKLLKEKLAKHQSTVWLVNTGWTGGSYGKGNRIDLKLTRNMLKAALNGDLDDVEFIKDSIFNLSIPTYCPDVPSEVLQPRNTWKDQQTYESKAQELSKMFEAKTLEYRCYSK